MKENGKDFNINKVIEEFEALTKDAEKVQKETLKRILEDNASAEYLLSLGLNGRTDPESFKACVPLITHKDLEPYINRILDGESSSILTGKPITTMNLSSGTTQGKPKYLPFTDELFETAIPTFQINFSYRNREFPIKNGKALSFMYGSKQFKTKGGVTAGTASANVLGDNRYRILMAELQTQPCCPYEVIFGSDFQQSLYCHLLCGLIFSDQVQFVSAIFAHSLVQAFKTFEQVWEELCNDIREGVLSSRVTVPSIRTAVSEILKPNPDLANLIHKKCKGLMSNNNNWYGLIQELFPNAMYVQGIMSGSMEPYVKKLKHYAGDLALVTSDYGSSEGWIGTNVDPKVPPELAAYTVLPQNCYFEFIPLGENSVDPKPVGLTEVKLGQDYEIVMTTKAGLYRYMLGDIVKVIGFHNSTPKLKFVSRSNTLLSINIDKNSEKDLQVAVEAASNLLAEEKLEVIDYTSHIELSKEPGHYVIFLEISGEASDEVLSECCNALDRSFVDVGYTGSRKANCIAALELRVVSRGTFQKILEHSLGLGASGTQFKTPRCVGHTNSKVLQILNDNVVKIYFSTVYN